MKLERINKGSGAAVGFVLVCGLFAVLSIGVKLSQTSVPVDADRGTEISKARAEMQASEDTALNSAATLDAQRGIVRLPLDTALQLAEQVWKDPAAGRANLNARAEKAAAELPKAPEKPSVFE